VFESVMAVPSVPVPGLCVLAWTVRGLLSGERVSCRARYPSCLKAWFSKWAPHEGARHARFVVVSSGKWRGKSRTISSHGEHLMTKRGSWMVDQGSWIVDQGSWIMDPYPVWAYPCKTWDAPVSVSSIEYRVSSIEYRVSSINRKVSLEQVAYCTVAWISPISVYSM
jgi:hypothetical protein